LDVCSGFFSPEKTNQKLSLVEKKIHIVLFLVFIADQGRCKKSHLQNSIETWQILLKRCFL